MTATVTPSFKRIRSAAEAAEFDAIVNKLIKARRMTAEAKKADEEAKADLEKYRAKHGDNMIGQTTMIMIDPNAKQNRLVDDLVREALGEAAYKACRKDFTYTKYTPKALEAE